MVSVLFSRSDSVYKDLGLDCWDIERDARLFIGNNPVIAHPPCRAWGRLAHLAKPRPDEKELALFAVSVIKKNGGVLEHPRASKLWKVINPGKGYFLSVRQSWFGHKAEKSTLLYICGVPRSKLPPVPLCFKAIEYVVSSSNRIQGLKPGKRSISKKEREATPLLFAQWLIQVASLVDRNLL